MLAGIKTIAHGAWKVAFAAGAGVAVLLICVAACIFTLATAAPKLRA